MKNYKGFVHDIVLMVLCVCFGFIICCDVQIWSEPQIIPEPEVITEYVYIESEPEVITEQVYVPVATDEFLRDYLTEEDEYYLMDKAMAEAEGEGVTGQCWVMYTILCRCEVYGKTIKEVCESSTFDSSRNRSGLKPNEDCLKALELIKEGWSPKPLWFARGQYHQNLGYPLCQYGNHCFSMK